jgi:hypothetical protein
VKYIIAFRRNDRLGTEEYDGGNTIADARKEAAFFCEHVPEVRVRICTVDHSTDRLKTVEIVREGR